MMKRRSFNWCFANIVHKLFLVSVLLDHCLGIDVFDADKPELIFPLSRLDNARHMPPFEDKKQSGEYSEYPRSRTHTTIFRNPEVRQLVLGDESSNSDLLRRVNVGNYGLENALKEIFFTKERVNKRGRAVKLIPRIGRKKRSAPDENKETDTPAPSKSFSDDLNNGRSIWSKFKEIEDDYNSMMDKKNYRNKSSMMMPRIGRKDFADIDEFEKRVVAFTPRIGRAALIPRIGRSDLKFRLKTRGAFIPRIGRRAALVPRIGRSLSHEEETE